METVGCSDQETRQSSRKSVPQHHNAYLDPKKPVFRVETYQFLRDIVTPAKQQFIFGRRGRGGKGNP